MGTTRNSRAIRALRPGGLTVDGRTPRQLLAQTLPTAALFNFYDDTATRAGDWSAFFEKIPLVRYASTAEMDVKEQERYFRASLDKLGGAINEDDPGQIAAAWNVIERLMVFYQQIDADAKLFDELAGSGGRGASRVQARQQLIAADYGELLQEAVASYMTALRQAISSVLAPNYQVVLAWAEWLAVKHPPPTGLLRQPGGQRALLPPAGLNPAWWGQATMLEVLPADAPGEFVRQLTAATWSTKSTVAQLVEKAAYWFARCYERPENLPPHFALYLAFIRQFAGAQAALNTLPARHCSYYYRTVLGLAPAGARPDAAFVAFTAVPGGWTDLPAGTALVAGKDPTGQPVIYRTRQATTVTSSAVTQMATVFLRDRGEKATGYYVAPHADSADGAGAALPTGGAWATVGEDQAGLAPADRTMADGRIGFAFSSPVLHLEEGARDITLEIAFAPSGPTPTGSPLSDDTQVLLWLVDYSSAKGWAIPSGKMQCTLKYFQSAEGDLVPVSLSASLNLAVGDAPCINWVSAPSEPAYDPRTPVLRVRYPNPLDWFTGPDPAAAARLSAAFAAAKISGVTVNVSATGLCDLVLAGPTGKLVPPGKPVAPFGSPPQAAGRFAIGKVELFRKKLTTLAITLKWQGLPANDNGLTDYYADYNALLVPPPEPLFGNTQYTASLAALVNRVWTPVPVAESLPPSPPTAPPANKYLFHWPNCMSQPAPALVGKLDASSNWSAEPAALPAINPVPDYALAGPLEYTPSTVTGFFGLTLGSPDYVFGQNLYPTLVSTIAINNALVLIQAAKAPTGTPLPSAAQTNPGTAYAQLKTPAPKTLLSRMRSLFSKTAAPVSTFKPKLFTALEKTSALPPEVATAVSNAGHDPKAILKAVDSLEGKTFSSPATFQQVIATTLGLDPTVPLDAEALAQIIHWLAGLNPKGPSSLAIAEALVGLEGIQSPPPLPLVPLVSGVTVDYSASTTLDLTGNKSTAPGWDRLWALGPLSVYPRPTGLAPLLPAVAPGGCLYIGFSNIQPPETVSLLFIMEAVPAATPPPDDPPVWSCLVGDTWSDAVLGAARVHDETWGFLRTGIVRIDLPETADTVHTVMPSGCVWLRAQVRNPAQHLRTIQVLSHAAEADWTPPVPPAAAVIAAHFAQPLPAGTITALQIPNPAVAKVLQPLPGQGGAPAEDDDDFNLRVSERLRHKGRAVAGPDYERLLLQQYPAVFSARAVPPAAASEAGTVTLVVLPTVTIPPAAPPPGFVAGDLLAFENALAAVAPLSARIVAINPEYESIWVRAEVDFAKDRSLLYYQALLTADLKAFISPWIYNQAAVRDPVQTFHVSDFSAFIRARPYVLQLGRCEVYPGVPPRLAAQVLPAPLQNIAPRSPRALLISAASHLIEPLPAP